MRLCNHYGCNHVAGTRVNSNLLTNIYTEQLADIYVVISCACLHGRPMQDPGLGSNKLARSCSLPLASPCRRDSSWPAAGGRGAGGWAAHARKEQTRRHAGAARTDLGRVEDRWGTVGSSSRGRGRGFWRRLVEEQDQEEQKEQAIGRGWGRKGC